MIKCENITKIYKTGETELKVLKEVSFEIAKGEFVAIIGLSGSGKSTLMHILGALDRPKNSTSFFIANKKSSERSSDGSSEI